MLRHPGRRPSRPAFRRAPQDDGDRADECPNKHHRSREAYALRALPISLTSNEGSGAPTGARVRRHPLLCADHSRGPHASPRRVAFTVSARRGTLASRRSTAAVFWPRAHLGKAFGRCLSRRCPSCLAMLHSQVPLVVAGGRCRSGASRGSWSRASPQDAASHSAYGTSPEDALDERDGTTIGAGKRASN
jgi:hypothetical protein